MHPNHGSTFWGVYAVHPLNEIRGGNIDLYYLGLARKNAPFEKGSRRCATISLVRLQESRRMNLAAHVKRDKK
jgi:hypothetical protein